MQDDIMTVKTAADTYGISRCTIYRWIRQGMPVLRKRNLIRLRRIDLEGWMHDHNNYNEKPIDQLEAHLKAAQSPTI